MNISNCSSHFPRQSAPQLKTAEDEKELKSDEKDKFRIEKVKADLLEVDQVTKEVSFWENLFFFAQLAGA